MKAQPKERKYASKITGGHRRCEHKWVRESEQVSSDEIMHGKKEGTNNKLSLWLST